MFSSKLVLVTGASGRIGNRVVQRLIDRGARVRTLVMRDDPAREKLEELDAEIIAGDLASGVGLDIACKDVDYIVHLGAIMAWTTEDHTRLFEVNLQGTYRLLEAVRLHAPHVKRVLLASSDATYPAANALYAPIDETHPQQPTSFYGMTKQVGEVMGAFYSRSFGLPITHARFAYTLAPQEVLDPVNVHSGHLFHLSARISQLRRRSTLSPQQQEVLEMLLALQSDSGDEKIMNLCGEDGEPWTYTLCHVDDLTDGILLMLQHPCAIGDVFNLGPPAPFTFDVASNYVAQKTGIPVVDVRLPGPATNYVVDCSKARQMLGYQPKFDIFSMIDAAVSEGLEH